MRDTAVGEIFQIDPMMGSDTPEPQTSLVSRSRAYAPVDHPSRSITARSGSADLHGGPQSSPLGSKVSYSTTQLWSSSGASPATTDSETSWGASLVTSSKMPLAVYRAVSSCGPAPSTGSHEYSPGEGWPHAVP